MAWMNLGIVAILILISFFFLLQKIYFFATDEVGLVSYATAHVADDSSGRFFAMTPFTNWARAQAGSLNRSL